MHLSKLSLPMRLTYIRLIGSPFILPFLFVYLLPQNIPWLNYSLAALFFLFGLTDFLDGYLARKYQQESKIGALLDHVADKFLLYSTLVALVATSKIHFFWAIVWIGREFFIMTLRYIALENNVAITVSSYGKLKTTIQICYLTVAIANPYCEIGLFESYWNVTELILLFLGTLLSLGSAYNYFAEFRKTTH